MYILLITKCSAMKMRLSGVARANIKVAIEVALVKVPVSMVYSCILSTTASDDFIPLFEEFNQIHKLTVMMTSATTARITPAVKIHRRCTTNAVNVPYCIDLMTTAHPQAKRADKTNPNKGTRKMYRLDWLSDASLQTRHEKKALYYKRNECRQSNRNR